MRSYCATVPLFVAALLLAACSSLPPRSDAGIVVVEPGAFDRVLRMEPLLLSATPDGIRSWSAEELFAAGNDAYDQGEWYEAVAYYDRLLREFGDDPLVPSVLFNAGLASEHDGDLDRSEAYFAALVDRFPEHQLVPSALWNLVELAEQREQWQRVITAIAALQRFDLSPNDVVELDARMWIARTALDPTDTNLERLEVVALEYGRRLREGQALPRDSYARIFFMIGEVYLGRSQAVVVDPDSKNLEDDLEAKAQWLLRAQDGYMRAVRALDPYWATAAVFRIGFAYESFYADLVQAPAPAALAGVEREVYFEEVRKILEPVRNKAELAYGRIIRFARQYAVETDWVARAEEHLARLKSLTLPDSP